MKLTHLKGYLKALFFKLTDTINGEFKSKKAKLHIVKKNYAYIEVDNTRYYFHGDTKTEKIELLNGEKVTKTVIPYDGWERSYK